MVTLLPLSVLLGIGMLWIFGLTSNQAAIRAVKREMQARLYEMRLFIDEPQLICKAQWGLLRANFRYLALMLVPAAAMAIPMIVIFGRLECYYGYRPLEPGKEAVVTIQMKERAQDMITTLRVPDGIAVESPAVRVEGERQISWRIRALRPVRGEMQFVLPAQVVEKSVLSGAGPQYLSVRRVSSPFDLIRYPGESRLPPGPVDWIELRYPRATIYALGFNLPWLVWTLILSIASTLILKRKFRVSF